MNLSKLLDPFPANDIEWRIQQMGKSGDKYWAIVLAYVTNRAIQSRLDDVCGPENWKNEYQQAPNGGVMCGVSIWCDSKKQWITKYDGADNTQMEAVKGGLSGAMKRAAVQWGIGRYLYNLEATFANCVTEKPKNMDGWKQQYHKETKTKVYWEIPGLPLWALPKPDLLSDDQLATIRNALGALDMGEDTICHMAKTSTLEEIESKRYAKLKEWLDEQGRFLESSQEGE